MMIMVLVLAPLVLVAVVLVAVVLVAGSCSTSVGLLVLWSIDYPKTGIPCKMEILK